MFILLRPRLSCFSPSLLSFFSSSPLLSSPLLSSLLLSGVGVLTCKSFSTDINSESFGVVRGSSDNTKYALDQVEGTTLSVTMSTSSKPEYINGDGTMMLIKSGNIIVSNTWVATPLLSSNDLDGNCATLPLPPPILTTAWDEDSQTDMNCKQAERETEKRRKEGEERKREH